MAKKNQTYPKAPKLSEILNTSTLEQYGMSRRELAAQYNYVRKTIGRRESQFQRAGIDDSFSESVRSGNIKSLRQLSNKSALIAELNRLEGFLLDPKSTVKGAIKALEINEKRRQSLSETLHRDLSGEEYDSIGKFLGAMQERAGQMWKKFSDQGVKLWEESQRLNLDPGQFLRNYDYWLEHAEALEEARPLNFEHTKPSSYIRQLNLERVKEWRQTAAAEDWSADD